MASKQVVALSDATFHSEVLESQAPVLVDFWAPWCGPCRAIGPTIDELAIEYAGRVKVAKLNVDENPGSARKYGVRSIPTLLVFHRGEVVERRVGGAPRAQLAAMLDTALRFAAGARKAG